MWCVVNDSPPPGWLPLPDDETLCMEGWWSACPAPDGRPALILCATLAHPVARLVAELGTDMALICTPARLHDRPAGLAAAIRARGRMAMARRHAPVAVLCPTADGEGLLDTTCREESLRLLDLTDTLPAVGFGPPDRDCFVATDLMVRAFERLVWTALSLDRHPELIEALFGTMRRFVHLAADDDPGTASAAEASAARLGLPLERQVLNRDALRDMLLRLDR